MKPIVQSSTWQSACFEERAGLLTLQENRVLGSVGSLPPTLRLSPEPFMSFVVKQSCTPVRISAFDHFSLATYSK